MYFLIGGDDLSGEYNTVWDKVKIKLHGDEVTDFHDKKIHKVDFNHTCLAVLSLDCNLREDKSYYLQAFLKICKYIEKMQLHILIIIWVVLVPLMSPMKNSCKVNVFWERNSENMYFERVYLKIFKNVFILKE